MSSGLRRTLVSISLLFLVGTAVVIVNQTIQVAQLADRVHPDFGQAVLWGLVSIYVVLVIVPVVLFMRLPPPLVPPAQTDGPAFDRHVRALRARLRKSPRLAGRPLGFWTPRQTS